MTLEMFEGGRRILSIHVHPLCYAVVVYLEGRSYRLFLLMFGRNKLDKLMRLLVF